MPQNSSEKGEQGRDDGLHIIVDYLFPDLDTYEAGLYFFFYRKTIYIGEVSIIIGKRAISSRFVHRTMGGGKENKGGLWVNYQHLSRALNSLERKGCIKSGDVSRDGTLYIVIPPHEIANVINKLSSESAMKVPTPDYFSDPIYRKEAFERDNWICCYRGGKLTTTTATIDHSVPQSKGGGHDIGNLRTSCLMCNSIESVKSYEEAAPLSAGINRSPEIQGGESTLEVIAPRLNELPLRRNSYGTYYMPYIYIPTETG